jgi:hypothetical protein
MKSFIFSTIYHFVIFYIASRVVWNFGQVMATVLRIRDVIPDPNFFPSRIQGQRDSRIRIRIRIKEFRYFSPKNRSKVSEIRSRMLIPGPDPGSGIRILIFYLPIRIPDPVVKKSPDPGSGSATLLGKAEGSHVRVYVILTISITASIRSGLVPGSIGSVDPDPD